MSLRFFAVPVIGAALCLGGAAQAADANGRFAIRGAGLQTCGNLVQAQDQRTSDLALYAGWIDGYLTGFNQFTDDTFEAMPWQTAGTLLSLTTQLCRTRPDDTGFMTAFVDLLRDFVSVRLTEESAARSVTSGGRTLVLYVDTVAALEAQLTAEGFDPGPVDGLFTAETIAALGAFQEAEGLEVTGLPDQRTLFRAFVQGGASDQ